MSYKMFSMDVTSIYPRLVPILKTTTIANDNGELHNEHGPAVIWLSGALEWRVNGYLFTFDEWCIELNKSDSEKALLLLKWVR